MNANDGLYSMTLGLLLLSVVTVGGVYALMFAAGVDARLPGPLLRFGWRAGVWLLKAVLLAVILLSFLLTGLAPYAIVIGIGWATWRFILSPRARTQRLRRARSVEDWT